MTATATGALRKMRVAPGEPVAYRLRLGESEVPLNPLLGARVALVFSGRITCVACGRPTRRSFGQGHCWRCFRALAGCDTCIVRPELCHFHAGTCREPGWGLEHCMRPHVVYLANTSGLKVGITRAGQIPTRWIDQGAAAALPVLRVATRRDSGLVEAALRAGVADRTDWRRMLRGAPPAADLEGERDRLLAAHPPPEAELSAPAEPVAGVAPLAIGYPVLEYPRAVTSRTAERSARIEGTLLGVKGQYLILDTGVVNVRRHAGYEATFEVAAGR